MCSYIKKVSVPATEARTLFLWWHLNKTTILIRREVGYAVIWNNNSYGTYSDCRGYSASYEYCERGNQMQFHLTKSGNQNNHPKWLITILLSWGTFVFALFFATLIGSIARQAGVSKLLQQGIQSGLVTLITVPLLYFFLKRTSSRPFCSIGLSGWRQAVSCKWFAIYSWNWVSCYHIRITSFYCCLLDSSFNSCVL